MSLKNVRDNRAATPTAGRESETGITDQVVPNIEILVIVVRIREVRAISTDHRWDTAVQAVVLKWDIVDRDISSSAPWAMNHPANPT